MMMASGDSLVESSVSAALRPWSATVWAARPAGHGSTETSDQLVSLGGRLGIELSFDERGYEARFPLVAADASDADATAQRRWFYLAADLGLPAWPATVVSVVSIEG